jgi:hypothetical protein
MLVTVTQIAETVSYLVCVTVGFTFLQATKALRENRGIVLLCFYTSALEGGKG